MTKQKEIQVNFNFHFHFSDSKKIKQKKLKKVEDGYKLIISNLQETIQNLSEAKESIEHLPSEFYVKKVVSIYSSSKVLNKLYKMVHDNLLKTSDNHLFSKNYCIKLLIYNIEDFLLNEYNELIEPSKETINFVKGRQKKSEIMEDYEFEDCKVFSFHLEEIYLLKLHRACLTYFKFKIKDLDSYNLSLFFNDIMNEIQHNDLKIYDLDYLNSEKIIRQNNY